MNKVLKGLISLGFALTSASTWAYGTGWSSYPLLTEKKLISTEFTGITSSGGGVGLQARYTQKLNPSILVDGGIGISSGERDSRLFMGADFELFPDYQNQPRVSVKANWENAEEFGSRKNILSIAPQVSKGFSFWGEEAFPFVALPVGLRLNGDSNSYESTVNLNLGITGNLPLEGYRHLMANFETTIGLKDSFTGVFLGISYPLN